MYVCTYVCMYVCMYVCTYVRTYVRTYVPDESTSKQRNLREPTGVTFPVSEKRVFARNKFAPQFPLGGCAVWPLNSL